MKSHIRSTISLALIMVVLSLAFLPQYASAQTPTGTETSTATATVTVTDTATLTATATLTNTATVTPTTTATLTSTVASTATATPTATATATATPTRTATLTPTSGPSATPTSTLVPGVIMGYHYVRAGETLYCIGRAYQVSPWAIANKNWLRYPYWIYSWQRLAIPNMTWSNMPSGPVCAKQFTPGATPAPTVTPSPSGGCRVNYWVRYGDTLSWIAYRFNSSVYAIATKNHIPNPNWIWAGRWLCIP